MSYYKKYLKYKNKYLQLKNNIQIGGGPPSNHIIKNIGLFEKNSDMDNFLNPIYGFIYCNIGFIKNHYNFKDENMNKFIRDCFHKLGEIIQPTRVLFKIKPKDIGILLGYLYCYKNYYKELDCKIIKLLYLKKQDKTNIKQIDEKIKLLRQQFNTLPITLSTNIQKFKTDIYNYIKNNIDNKEYFRIILAILWYISNDKNDIKEYYEGINEAFCYFNRQFNQIIPLINIPKCFIEDIFNDEVSMKDMSFEKTLYIASGLISTTLPIYNQDYSNYKGHDFPDCGESIIRSFINIICYNKSIHRFDIDILNKYGAIDKLLQYYHVFNNFEKQTSANELQIFGKKINSRDAWNIVVSDLPNVTYRDKDLKYNIAGDESEENFLQVIKSLFNKINTFDDFGLNIVLILLII